MKEFLKNENWKMIESGLKTITVEELLNHSSREYNPQIWKQSIERMTGYENCQFYQRERGSYGYNRWLVSYVVDGIKVIKEWSGYGACIHNGGWSELFIEDGNIYQRFFVANGETGRLNNDVHARAHMRIISKWLFETGFVSTDF